MRNADCATSSLESMKNVGVEMKVKDLITKLSEFDPELPVAIADWNENYSRPSEDAAECVGVSEGEYYTGARAVVGKVVVIGG